MFVSKITASGNDFIITYNFREDDYAGVARGICDRNYGLGADGFIVLLPSNSYDLRWLFYNSDGSMASMCGNGTRAAGYFAYENSLTSSIISLQTDAGIVNIEVTDDGVKTAFTPPNLLKESLFEYDREWMLIDTGVPHLVCLDDKIDSLQTDALKALRHKYNANINIGAVKDTQNISIRTFERGVEAETKACGTGMAALFYLLMLKKIVQQNALITPASGEKLQFISEESKIFFKGKVRKVFDTIVHKNEFKESC